MKETTIKEKLSQFCAVEGHMPEELTHIHNDGKNLVASNGHILACLHLPEYPGAENIGSDVPDYPDWRKVIPNNLIATGMFSPDVLITNPAPEPEAKKCVKCNGSGVIDHKCDCIFCEGVEEECSECDGEGSHIPHHVPDLVAIGSHYYNAELLNRIAAFMQALQIPNVALNEHENGITAIQSQGVFCLIMPVMVFPDWDCPNNIIHHIELVQEE